MLVGDLSSRMHELKHLVHEALRIMGYMPVQDYLPFLGYWFDPNGAIQDMQKVTNLCFYCFLAFRCEFIKTGCWMPSSKSTEISHQG